ncbi:hypothetical protein F5Y05DRAFT_61593 [Hypoxylon sp. FL0543]|nr:hypothetical protein F5Y05DRAFT_61593 [Hypoxylon sp. FL0543]
MLQEPSTSDDASAGEEYERPLSSKLGIKFGGMHLRRAYQGGVARMVTPPSTNGFFHGTSATFRSGAKSGRSRYHPHSRLQVLEAGAISEPRAALHFTIGHDGKSPRTPSITSQISKLHSLLTDDKHIHPIYQSVAVVVHTNNKDVIAHMIALKRVTGAHIVIMGGSEAHLLATELAKADVSVIVAPLLGRPELPSRPAPSRQIRTADIDGRGRQGRYLELGRSK